jgi:H+/Cl- antiporter ClcA
MNPSALLFLLLLSIFAGLWAAFYARRAYLNTRKILDKLEK